MRDSIRIRLACVIGARPNLMKMAPLMRALEAYPHVQAVLIHTGQHYDESLGDVFFAELGIRRPDVGLEVGSGTHAEQTTRVLARFKKMLQHGTPEGYRYDRVAVVGDGELDRGCGVGRGQASCPGGPRGGRAAKL